MSKTIRNSKYLKGFAYLCKMHLVPILLYKVGGSSITSTKIEIFWIWKLFQKAVIKSSAKMVTNSCISASFLSKMRSQKKSTGKLSNVKLLQEQVILNNNNSQNFFHAPTTTTFYFWYSQIIIQTLVNSSLQSNFDIKTLC